MNLRIKLGLMVTAMALLAVACGGTYDRETAIEDLVDESGITEGQAECIIDGVEAEFGIERLESRGDLTEAEEEVLLDLTFDCVFAGGSNGGNGSTAGATEAAAGSDAAPATLFSATDFEPACRGVGIGAAAPYLPGDGINFIVALEGEAPSYGAHFGALADGWEAPWETIDQTELVVCMNRVETRAGELCTGYQDEESGIEWEVQTFGARYDVSLVEAQTAATVATAQFDAPADDCPFFSSYFEGDPNPKPDYATPDDEVQAWLVTYVQG